MIASGRSNQSAHDFSLHSDQESTAPAMRTFATAHSARTRIDEMNQVERKKKKELKNNNDCCCLLYMYMILDYFPLILAVKFMSTYTYVYPRAQTATTSKGPKSKPMLFAYQERMSGCLWVQLGNPELSLIA